jgi:hypothetical protein
MKYVIAALIFLSATIAQAQIVNVKIDQCWLVQTPSPSADVASYNVKLALQTGGPYTLREVNVPVASWQPAVQTPGDIFITCVQAGFDLADITQGSHVDYFGITTAVNIVGLESGPSNEFSARLHKAPGPPSNVKIQKTQP